MREGTTVEADLVPGLPLLFLAQTVAQVLEGGVLAVVERLPTRLERLRDAAVCVNSARGEMCTTGSPLPP